MERGVQGDYILSTAMPETFLAFVPRPLPPVPPLYFNECRSHRLSSSKQISSYSYLNCERTKSQKSKNSRKVGKWFICLSTLFRNSFK